VLRDNLQAGILSNLRIDIDTPISQPGGSSQPSAEQISALTEMGFTSLQAAKALRETVSTRGALCLICLIHFHREEALNAQSNGCLITQMTLERKKQRL
jgi:hypothetical protein